jgi:hypothetical protein
MKLQRIDRLKEPPIIGQSYLVPIVRGKWHGLLRDWPVIGLRHDDLEFLNFHLHHYHVDTRFLRARRNLLASAPYTPLHEPHYQNDAPPLGKPSFARRKCLREQHVFSGPHHVFGMMKDAFAGQQCAKGKRGFVCPHKQFPLGSTPAINGVITCPLHGLRIDAETGVLLGRSK